MKLNLLYYQCVQHHNFKGTFGFSIKLYVLYNYVFGQRDGISLPFRPFTDTDFSDQDNKAQRMWWGNWDVGEVRRMWGNCNCYTQCIFSSDNAVSGVPYNVKPKY